MSTSNLIPCDLGIIILTLQKRNKSPETHNNPLGSHSRSGQLASPSGLS